ncbi:MAG: ABC transporter ATP-binding protein [Lachnospiraceae bacterium]
MITLKNIVKKYNEGMDNEVVALGGFDLKINKREMVAIMGPSGSGKSTLLNVVGLIDEPTSGEYYLDGEEVSCLSDKKRSAIRNQKIGFVLQDFGLLMDRTAEENILVPLLFSKIPFSKSKKRIVPIMEQLGISNLAKRRITELSGGQAQRVAIARAMVNSPSLILADEPTGALDSHTAKEVVCLFRELNALGTTIVIVTHNAAVANSCDKIYTIKDGIIS